MTLLLFACSVSTLFLRAGIAVRQTGQEGIFESQSLGPCWVSSELLVVVLRPGLRESA